MFATFLFGNQLDPNPQQKRPADELEIGIHQQTHREKRQYQAQPDRAQDAPEYPEPALPPRQIAAGERDHHGVVSRQQDVHHDDLCDCNQELRRQPTAINAPSPQGCASP